MDLIDYSLLKDIKNDKFTQKLELLFNNGELEYYKPKGDIGVSSLHVPLSFIAAAGINIPKYVTEEKLVWHDKLSEESWLHILPNKTLDEILIRENSAEMQNSSHQAILTKKILDKDCNRLNNHTIYDFARLELEFKTSDSDSLAAFAYHKQLGKFSIVDKIEKRQSLELKLAGIYQFNKTSLVENYALSLIIAKTPNGKVTYRFKDNNNNNNRNIDNDNNEDIGNGFFTLSTEQYKILAAAKEVSITYSLNKDIGVVLHELHYDNTIVHAYKEMVKEGIDKEELENQSSAIQKQEPYIEVLAERLYNSWIEKGLVLKENINDYKKRICINKRLYSIDDKIEVSQLAEFAAISVSAIDMGYRKANWEIEVKGIYTTAKSFLYLANKDTFPKGGMYKTASILAILGIKENEIAEANEVFNIRKKNEKEINLDNPNQLNLSKTTAVSIIRQVYNHLFETTIQKYFVND